MKTLVLVTTELRGVFVGVGPIEPDADKRITLSDAKMVVFWPVECHGVLGLAAEGPKNGARVGPAVPTLTLTGVTSVATCTEVAVKAFSRGYWN